MNLKNYIKNLNEFLIKENSENENVQQVTPQQNDMGEPTTPPEKVSEEENNNTEALKDLLARFQEFLKNIEGKITLEEIQAAAVENSQQGQTPAQPTEQTMQPTNQVPQQQAAPQQAAQA